MLERGEDVLARHRGPVGIRQALAQLDRPFVGRGVGRDGFGQPHLRPLVRRRGERAVDVGDGHHDARRRRRVGVQGVGRGERRADAQLLRGALGRAAARIPSRASRDDEGDARGQGRQAGPPSSLHDMSLSIADVPPARGACRAAGPDPIIQNSKDV